MKDFRYIGSASAFFVRQSQAGAKNLYHFRNRFRLISAETLLLLLLAWSGLIVPSPAQRLSSQLSAVSDSIEIPDPDKAASELNHHIAGIALIAIGIMVICGRKYDRLKFLQGVWPLLFIAAGLFLAAWSDDEIWPRGDRSWTWLIAHDVEARQHKIYAVLLVAIGLAEYLRAHGRLSKGWATWLFPCLAVFGGTFLFFHDHGSHSAVQPDFAAVSPVNACTTGDSDSNHSRTLAHLRSSGPTHTHEHTHGLGADGPPNASAVIGGTELQQRPPSPAAETNLHNHARTGAMLRIERQHMWFAVLGFCIALFKYLDDRQFPVKGSAVYPWGHCIVALGVLLLLYTE